ncbi:MAG TPA: hypothetical protein VHG89_03735 [Verrucomicrobiae bacterium]|nr:hypothetical protein [Verrucomicrobiae bacterium]
MIATNSTTDMERAKFLEKLVAESRAKNGLLLAEFENEFLASYQGYHQYHRFFNAGHGGRRKVCDRLMRKYQNLLTP